MKYKRQAFTRWNTRITAPSIVKSIGAAIVGCSEHVASGHLLKSRDIVPLLTIAPKVSRLIV